MAQVTITEVRNARSMNEENTIIDVEINHPEYGWIPYYLTYYDTDTTIDNDVLLGLIGSNFEAYVPPTQAELDAQAAVGVRHQRDWLLQTQVDPIVSNPLRWDSLTDEEKLEVTVFRQNLLDISQQSGWPHYIEWPQKPECLPNHSLA